MGHRGGRSGGHRGGHHSHHSSGHHFGHHSHHFHSNRRHGSSLPSPELALHNQREYYTCCSVVSTIRAIMFVIAVVLWILYAM